MAIRWLGLRVEAKRNAFMRMLFCNTLETIVLCGLTPATQMDMGSFELDGEWRQYHGWSVKRPMDRLQRQSMKQLILVAMGIWAAAPKTILGGQLQQKIAQTNFSTALIRVANVITKQN